MPIGKAGVTFEMIASDRQIHRSKAAHRLLNKLISVNRCRLDAVPVPTETNISPVLSHVNS